MAANMGGSWTGTHVPSPYLAQGHELSSAFWPQSVATLGLGVVWDIRRAAEQLPLP